MWYYVLKGKIVFAKLCLELCPKVYVFLFLIALLSSRKFSIKIQKTLIILARQLGLKMYPIPTVIISSHFRGFFDLDVFEKVFIHPG